MSIVLLRSGEDVSSFVIGQFGDQRLAKVGALLFKRLSEKLNVCIKSLAGNRATEVAFNRFLSNEEVALASISDEFSGKTNAACTDKSHVLCIQDTVQLTYPTQWIKENNFGPTGDTETKGLFVHPGIIVNAFNRDVLGLSSVLTWCREEKSSIDKNRPIEEKESIRWIETALSAKEKIKNAETLTVIGDRESDILELFKRVPNEKTHLIVRASHDRRLMTEEKISERLANEPVVGTHEIELPAITGRRRARTASLDIKYTKLELGHGNSGESLDIFCVSAVETSTVTDSLGFINDALDLLAQSGHTNFDLVYLALDH